MQHKRTTFCSPPEDCHFQWGVWERFPSPCTCIFKASPWYGANWTVPPHLTDLLPWITKARRYHEVDGSLEKAHQMTDPEHTTEGSGGGTEVLEWERWLLGVLVVRQAGSHWGIHQSPQPSWQRLKVLRTSGRRSETASPKWWDSVQQDDALLQHISLQATHQSLISWQLQLREQRHAKPSLLFSGLVPADSKKHEISLQVWHEWWRSTNQRMVAFSAVVMMVSQMLLIAFSHPGWGRWGLMCHDTVRIDDLFHNWRTCRCWRSWETFYIQGQSLVQAQCAKLAKCEGMFEGLGVPSRQPHGGGTEVIWLRCAAISFRGPRVGRLQPAVLKILPCTGGGVSHSTWMTLFWLHWPSFQQD